jgi:hypothetical protein
MDDLNSDHYRTANFIVNQKEMADLNQAGHFFLFKFIKLFLFF